ncbi:hypothetical protein BKA62DRAFT_711573 [Auriculariales sp. MPI-PUGE-AT-0066]|nr:hypothetical protein BKA62DRAFT_711573 [Auriculariales sp. MPI-PUGE-AT-0066]
MLDRADVFPNPQIRIKTLGVALFHQEYDKNDIDHLPRVFQRFAPNAALSITLGDASVCVVQLVSSFVDTYIQGGLRVVAQQKAGTFYALVTGVTDNTRTVAFRILLTLTTSANIIPSDSCCFTTLSGISGRITCIRLPCTLAKPFGFIKSQVAALTEVIVDLVDAPSDADRDTLEACPSTWTSEVAISFVHKLRNMDRRQSSKFPVVRQNEIYVPKLFTAELCKKITMKLRTRVPRAISPLYAPVLAIGLGLMPSINIIQLELEPGLSFRLPA